MLDENEEEEGSLDLDNYPDFVDLSHYLWQMDKLSSKTV